jgi:hypothetical protein
MAKIFGGSASRLEVYALFAAAVVLIGGSVAGAVVVTSSDSKPAEVAQVSVDTTVVDTTVAPTTTPVTEPGTATPPTTAAQRFYNPEPQAPVTSYPNQPVQTVAPQPIQDYSAYCTMPNVVGSQVSPYSQPRSPVEDAMRAAGCLMNTTPRWCVDPSLIPSARTPGGVAFVLSQSPSPGTLIHRSLGTYSITVRYYPDTSFSSINFSNGTTPC